MSVAVMESTTVAASFFSCCALLIDLRTPMTTTSFVLSAEPSVALGASVVCAAAGSAHDMTMAAVRARPDTPANCKRV